MDSVGVLICFEAKPDKVDGVEALLRTLAAQNQGEEATIAWFGFRLGPTTFGVFHAFADEAGRESHMAAFGEAVRAKASDCSPRLRRSTTLTLFRRSCPHDCRRSLTTSRRRSRRLRKLRRAEARAGPGAHRSRASVRISHVTRALLGPRYHLDS
jgi:quinol monooxygenase YgiN